MSALTRYRHLGTHVKTAVLGEPRAQATVGSVRDSQQSEATAFIAITRDLSQSLEIGITSIRLFDGAQRRQEPLIMGRRRVARRGDFDLQLIVTAKERESERRSARPVAVFD